MLVDEALGGAGSDGGAGIPAGLHVARAVLGALSHSRSPARLDAPLSCFALQLFLDDAKVKNFITCFKDVKFLAFFFKQLQLNCSGRYEADFPYVSPCGREHNFVRCDDRPIVFTQLLPGPGDAEVLSYCGGGDRLVVPFEPPRLAMLPESALAFEWSPCFEYRQGPAQPPTHFTWRGRRYDLTNELASGEEQERFQTPVWRRCCTHLEPAASPEGDGSPAAPVSGNTVAHSSKRSCPAAHAAQWDSGDSGSGDAGSRHPGSAPARWVPNVSTPFYSQPPPPLSAPFAPAPFAGTRNAAASRAASGRNLSARPTTLIPR
nr:PREDICTED: UPF0598 protein C8orf82 homolog [Apteryx mantelli mantelli]